MPSFGQIEQAEPDLAQRVQAVLSSATNAVLGTTRRDGSIRLSGADPYFHDGQLCIWSMPGARKGGDLRRNPTVAIHSIPWDSRKTREGAVEVGLADAKVNGRAELVSDSPRREAFRSWLRATRGGEPPDDWDLFTIDVDDVAVVFVDDGQLAVDHWSASGGRRTTRRG